ncbi:MAG: MotA/TolQ/ExbB proton channel family protein [Rhodospirillaceae bacterium]
MAEGDAHIYVAKSRSSMDLATVVGLLCGFAMISAAIVLGGSPESFINPPSILIVIGGTLAVTTACFSLAEMGRTLRIVAKTFFYSARDPSEAATQVLQATVQRHAKSTSVLRKMGEFAPAMGLIGTLIGLVQMLGNLDDPGTIGPSMAVALLTTFYGAVLVNMAFLPLASKLDRNSQEEALINNLYVMGAASIGNQENPRRLEMLLKSVLPPNKRVRYFD